MQEITPYQQAMTDFLTVQKTLSPCRTSAELRRAWSSATVQNLLKRMEVGQRKALEAMKDWYKKMIDRGEIDQYLETRQSVEARQNKAVKV